MITNAGRRDKKNGKAKRKVKRMIAEHLNVVLLCSEPRELAALTEVL